MWLETSPATGANIATCARRTPATAPSRRDASTPRRWVFERAHTRAQASIDEHVYLNIRTQRDADSEARNRNAFTSIISCAHTHTQVCITGIVMPRVQLGPVHHLSVGMCLYEWMVLWVAQQQLLYSKQRWIYSLLNKSGWMSMQMEAHATVPNVIFAWKPSSICELTRFHSPSVLICNSHCLAHKHGNSPWQTQINFCAFRKLHLTPGHINIGFVSISGRSLLIICMHGWLRWRLIQIVFSNFSLLLVVFPLLFFSLSSTSMC